MMDQEAVPHLEIRAVLFQEIGWWVAQCLEYDIAVQARTQEDLFQKLERALIGYLVLSLKKKGSHSLEWMPPAPRRYWEMYERAEPVETDLPQFPAAPAVPEIEIRARAA
jgi:hypothetical protein